MENVVAYVGLDQAKTFVRLQVSNVVDRTR